MAETQIRIGAAGLKKEGAHPDGRPWSLWFVTSESGIEFVTFDGGLMQRAFVNVGRSAHVTFDYDGPRRRLTGLTIIEEREAA